MEALPAERVGGLRQLIHDQVSRSDIHERIRACLTDMLAEGSDMSEQHIKQILRQRGLVDDVLKSLGYAEQPSQQAGPQAARPVFENHPPLNVFKRYLYVSFHGGKAFLESSRTEGGEDSTLSLNLSFNGQRFRGQHVLSCCDPSFTEGFLFELPETVTVSLGAVLPDPFLACAEPVHIAILKHDPAGDVALVGCHVLDWRQHVLRSLESSSGSFQAVEIMGVGAACAVPAGVLNIRADVLPAPPPALDVAVARSHLALERARVIDSERIFLVYAKQWWREYIELRPSHHQRLVKIFAADENGINRPACSFVRELDAGRLVDSPRQAARFVSLLALERQAAVGGTGAGGRVEQWSHPHTFLARGKGDIEDHAVLLCSLLLGFGLNAFVCIGAKMAPVDGGPVTMAHAWVATFGSDSSAVFWESLTAESEHPFRGVDCIFNHRSFYANIQPSNSLSECSLDITNESCWKPMSPDSIALQQRPFPAPPLLANPVDPISAAFQLERELRGMVTEARAEAGLTTAWDPHLGRILNQALYAYELQRSSGVVAGNEEFQQAIKHSIPPGHTFKGYPVQFTHLHGPRIFAACRTAAACQDIINARGDQVVHAVRIRVFPFPERAMAVWVMLAAKFRAVY